MRHNLFPFALIAAASLQGCSDKSAGTPAAEANKVTQTRMNDIDSLEGTISDEMIITDDANDEAALEPASETKTVSGKPEAKSAAKPAAPKPAVDAAADTGSDAAQ